ncbi:elongation factor Ts [Fistulifera solaris]|uniref:Elongation factor Ts, mitochondrial n=1 Tax=Fistulifera solaris TaxID=1519565 RepID=A0A1Z5JP75_FISSO|nr:elongation factor Ts [Fistulifera solaris]|eukprot:GAX15804.1 elongation factor Ts [Fistulifera solaris]
MSTTQRCSSILLRYASRTKSLYRFQQRCNFSAGFSMEALKELRTLTGAPIVECKKALQSTDGQVPSALDWLREHGAAKATSKVQGRETTQGLIGLQVAPDGKSASLVQVACETDFAALSARFVDFVTKVADATGTLSIGASSEDMFEAESGGESVKRLLDEAVVAIRENISVKQAIKFEATEAEGIFVGYVHNRVDGKDAGFAAAVVEVAPSKPGSVSREKLQEIGKRLAMHVVAARPTYLSSDDIPQDELTKEKDILRNQMGDSDKPPEILEKIVNGRLHKYYEQFCLLEQAHMIEESNPKVKGFLKDSSVVVKQFKLMTTGN